MPAAAKPPLGADQTEGGETHQARVFQHPANLIQRRGGPTAVSGVDTPKVAVQWIMAMSAVRIAVGTVELHLSDVGSLKAKRGVLKGLKEKVRHRFDVAVAEVDHHDAWQRATVAVACLSHDSRHANEVVSKAIGFIESLVDGYIIDIQTEIL